MNDSEPPKSKPRRYHLTLDRLLVGLLALVSVTAAEAHPPKHRRLSPVPFTEVRIEDDFWTPRIEVVCRGTIATCFQRFQQTGHVDNFAKAAGLTSGEFRGEVYADSDVYKVIEAAANLLHHHPDPKLQRVVEGVIDKIRAAQRPNGYLHTCFILQQPGRQWENIHRNELYCAGHLLEAGVGHYQATGKRTLLDVAVRLADNIDAAFGMKPGKCKLPPEHQEVELGLLRLYGVTGEERYLKLAEFFLERRGRFDGRRSYGPYAQDHQPVARQREAVGHSVRAAYMYAAMAELVGHTGNRQYLDALKRLWEDAVYKKMFVSGGVGLLARGDVHESFAGAYDLPNEQPDVDTCSVIGLVFWAHRMNLLEPDGQFGDVIERILYNRFLAGVSLDGRRFFYGCPLACRGPGSFQPGPGAECDEDHCRPKWFRCVCCPTNLPRMLSTVGGYAYAYTSDGVYIDQYIGSKTSIPLKTGEVQVTVQTRYPWCGTVRVGVDPQRSAEFAINLRIPGWAVGKEHPGGLYHAKQPAGEVTLKVNGRTVGDLGIHRGYARIRRRWSPGDVVELQLPMDIRRVKADPRVEAAQGRVALHRGPLLYCLEGMDHGGDVFHLALLPQTKLTARHRPQLLGGVTVIRGEAQAVSRQGRQRVVEPRPFMAVPFCVCDNRQPGPWIIWLPETPELAAPGEPTEGSP